MRKICSKENAINLYVWLEFLILTAVIIFICGYLHFLLIPLVGMLIAIRLKNNIEYFYKFVYSYLYWIYILQIYIYIRDSAYLFGVIGITISLIIFMLLKSEQLKGKTL